MRSQAIEKMLLKFIALTEDSTKLQLQQARMKASILLDRKVNSNAVIKEIMNEK